MTLDGSSKSLSVIEYHHLRASAYSGRTFLNYQDFAIEFEVLYGPPEHAWAEAKKEVLAQHRDLLVEEGVPRP